MPVSFVRVALIAALAGACTPARMQGFDTLAALGAGERIDVTGVPFWHSGAFSVGASRGTVRRLAVGEAIGWGPQGWTAAPTEVDAGLVARHGAIAFDVAGAAIGGRLEARCRYAREEVRGRAGGLDVAAPFRPLRLGCAYRIDGRDAGTLELAAATTPGAAEARIGVVEVDGATLVVRSSHRIEGTPVPMATPIGYTMAAADGDTVAAVELNGIGARRLILPRDPERRMAALAAGLTLALFWDPGDVD